jgi:hypothetical protein
MYYQVLGCLYLLSTEVHWLRTGVSWYKPKAAIVCLAIRQYLA